MSLFMCFDVESVGLHGEGYAVGWVVFRDGKEVDAGYAGCDSEMAGGTPADRDWINKHVDPHLPKHTCSKPVVVREIFWREWMRWKEEGAYLVADCCWPVEARFLVACIEDGNGDRNWDGPYPLHDVASARLVAGLDPLATVDRLPNEMPKHHPTADARQSGRLWLEVVEE